MADTTVVTAKYGTIITAIGKEKITAAILAGKQVNITHAAVGDGGGAYYKPTADQTGLINECWRGEIAYKRIGDTSPNMIDIKFIVPAEVGGFTIREGMVADDEGDVIAIWNTPDAQKIAVQDGVSFPLTMVAHIVVEDASAVSVTVNSALDTVSREELEQALKAHSAQVGSAIIRDITIPVTSWADYTAAEPGFEEYHYIADAVIEGCTERHFPVMAISIPSERAAATAGVSRTADTFEGYVRFYAKSLPTQDLAGTIQLRSENLADAGDVINGDVATDEEVAEVIDQVYGSENSGTASPTSVATDEEVAAMISDIFG